MTENSLAAVLDPRGFALRTWIGLVGLVLLGLAPFWMQFLFGGNQDLLMLRTLIAALFFGMFAMSWDTVSGYTGQISFGHALFFAVGGYSSALLNLGWGLPPAAAIVAGVVLAAVAGLLIGIPALRLEGPYLSLVTLVAPIILFRFFVFKSDVFGGEVGISTSPDPLIAANGFAQTTYVYYFIAFAAFVLVLAVLLAVTRSDAGAVFTAIREDEDAVAASGLNPAKFKIFAFVLSAAVGGFAGAVFVHTTGSPTPSQLLVQTVSIEVIIASVVGGMGTIVGAAVGGIFLSVFRDQLSDVAATIPGLGVHVGSLDLFLFAAVTLVLLFYLPGGVLPSAIRAGRRAIGADGAAADGGRTPLEQVRESFRDALRGGDDE